MIDVMALMGNELIEIERRTEKIEAHGVNPIAQRKRCRRIDVDPVLPAGRSVKRDNIFHLPVHRQLQREGAGLLTGDLGKPEWSA